MTVYPEYPEHSSESHVPTNERRPVPARSRRSLLRWATAGATVLALGAGGVLLGSSAASSFAQTGPNPQATPVVPAPPGQPGQGQPRQGAQPRAGGGLLGVRVEDATNGARVAAVIPGSAAANAGVQVGDVITAVNGQAVQNAQALRDRLGTLQVGSTVTLTLTRSGNTSPITVTASLTAPPHGGMHPGRRGHGGFGFGGVPGLDPLQGVAADQRFSHLLGSQTTVLDANNNRVTYQTVPGRVTSVSATSLSIQANDTSRGTLTFTINADTRVLVGGQRPQATATTTTTTPSATPTAGPRPKGSITDLRAGDNVVVVVDAANPSVAKAVAGGPQATTR